MIDIHCHYLPDVDDGARSLEEGLELLKAAEANGIDQAILTPHVHMGVYENSLTSLTPVFRHFQAAAVSAGIKVQLYLGAEVRLHPDALEMLENGDLPLLGSIGNARVLLLEFPDGRIPIGAFEACAHLIEHGVRPLIAHPERNKDVMRGTSRIKPFVDLGCMLQVTAASVIGGFGPQAQRVAQELIELGLVEVVATDSHNMRHRPPLLREAREAIALLYSRKLATLLTETNPATILSGRFGQPDQVLPAV